MPLPGLQESASLKMSTFAVTDGLRPEEVGHDNQLTGCPVDPQAEAIRGVRHRAQSRRPYLPKADAQMSTPPPMFLVSEQMNQELASRPPH